MLEYFRSLFGADQLAPHGYCLLWQPELIWTHVISDALIGLAYFSIPIALASFLTKRRDVEFGWVVWLFASFIMACGVTHFFSIWTLWYPDYGPEALVKAATAIVSVATAAALWPLLPKLIAIPSPAQLQMANESLSMRVAERDQAIASLRLETAERIKAEEMLRQSQKMEAIGQLSGGVAHDFNNMLMVITANLEKSLRLAPEGDQAIRHALSNALKGAERAADLTDKLLGFARKQSLTPAVYHPNEILRELESLLERSLGGNITIKTDFAPDVGHIHVDRNQMENAIINLAVNARQAMPNGGVLQITTCRGLDDDATDQEQVCIEISDTGLGMTAEVRDRAFEPFYTTKPIGEGTGLGLSQVYGFVKQSEGSIELTSQPGAGTVVRITLPTVGTGGEKEL